MTYEGFVHDLDENTYHAQPELSSTGAKKILKSAAHYKDYIENPHETKAAFDVGSAAHSKILGVGAQIAVYPDGDGPETHTMIGDDGEPVTLTNVLAVNGAVSTKAAKDFEKVSRDAGLIPVKRVTARVVDRMAESVLRDPRARRLLEGAAREVSAFATDPVTGLRIRGRFDALGDRAADVKTTGGEASETGFELDAFRYGYDVQQGHYEYIHEVLTGSEIPYFFIVVENHRPYLTGIHVLGPEESAAARDKARVARTRLAQSLATGEWPGYQNRSGGPIGTLRAPAFSIAEYTALVESEGVAA
ncbi:PD-(D/E)XK nuclease-like domain-containing protein [Microbacterium jejuense]|uniref:PD-(D/E)XK nuclease-like domain-containing protein n=1 Tax=Microbacterium jejuense TaxID=1263637 RepID=UPI0031ECF9B0